MDLLIANGRQRGHNHVEAIEPGPALNKMEPGSSDKNDDQQREKDKAEIGLDAHECGRYDWAFDPWLSTRLRIELQSHATTINSQPTNIKQKAFRGCTEGLLPSTGSTRTLWRLR